MHKKLHLGNISASIRSNNKKDFIMKILLAISALSAALFSTAANADISVSGSMTAVYVDVEGVSCTWWSNIIFNVNNN